MIYLSFSIFAFLVPQILLFDAFTCFTWFFNCLYNYISIRKDPNCRFILFVQFGFLSTLCFIWASFLFGLRLEKRYRKNYWGGCFILFVISYSIISFFFNPRGQF